MENRFRKSIEHYLKKVYRDLKDAEAEIEKVEETVIRKFKRNFEDTKETIENIQEEIQETQKKSWWKFWIHKK